MARGVLGRRTGKRGFPHGEFQVQFSGRDRVQVKRKALDYWYQNRSALKLTLRDFFARCRLSADERTIVFQGTPLDPAR